jgi:hypothetical protein
MTTSSPLIFDLSLPPPPVMNKSDYESDISQRGMDQLTMPENEPATEPEQGGGGVPDGYLETEVTICDRATNTAVDGTILFKPD